MDSTKRVLIVEDDLHIAELLRMHLRDEGYAVEHAADGHAGLRELERGGVSVQSHGVLHRAFSDLSPDEQEKELLRSRAALEDGLDKRVEVFAYPYGDAGTQPRRTSDALRRAGYRAACRYKGGPLRLPVRDRYHLPRLAMGPDTDLRAALEVR